MSTERDAVIRAIDSGNSKWMTAFRTSDPVLLASLFTFDGAILVDNGELINGHDAIRQRMGKFMEWMGPADMTIETIDVWIEDSLAYEAGRYEYRFTPKSEDSTGSFSGKYLVIWKQVDDQWLIYRDIGMEDK
ncbi:YybH family protein [Calditrichota bacterium]